MGWELKLASATHLLKCPKSIWIRLPLPTPKEMDGANLASFGLEY